jgi:hypothetical protein
MRDDWNREICERREKEPDFLATDETRNYTDKEKNLTEANRERRFLAGNQERGGNEGGGISN